MKAKLTRRTVEAFKATGRDELVWDDEVAGFGLKVTRTGTKTYLLQYRLGGRGSPTRRYTIGKHGSPWSVEAARDEAKRLLRLVAEGRDPAREREQAIEVTVAATSRTFRKVAEEFRDRYLKRHSPKHWPETWRTLEYDPVRAWGDKPVSDITARDVTKLLDAMLARKSRLRDADGKPRIGCPSQANHVHRALTTFFNWCALPNIGYVPTSPMVGIDKPAPEVERERVLADWEIRLIWQASDELGYPFGPWVKLALLTAQRRDEVATMERGEVDLEAGLWTIPKGKAKNRKEHMVPLCKAAVSVLEGLPWNHPLAFTTTGQTAVSGFSRAKERVDALVLAALRKEAERAGRNPDEVGPLEPWTFHDFRRTVSTNLAQMGIPQHVTEKLLNHQPTTQKGVARIYNRYEYLLERREALSAWEARLIGISDAAGRKVVEFDAYRTDRRRAS